VDAPVVIETEIQIMNDKLAVIFVAVSKPKERTPILSRRSKLISYLDRHTREQVSYFGPDGFLHRHDYAVDVLGGAKGAHYIGDYREHGGILTPHRRRIYPLGADNRKIPEPLVIKIDIARLGFEPA
jgi:hypothetical protein